jgi:hypothetical protein
MYLDQRCGRGAGDKREAVRRPLRAGAAVGLTQHDRQRDDAALDAPRRRVAGEHGAHDLAATGGAPQGPPQAGQAHRPGAHHDGVAGEGVGLHHLPTHHTRRRETQSIVRDAIGTSPTCMSSNPRACT